MSRQYQPYKDPSGGTPGWATLLIILFIVAVIVGLGVEVLKGIYPEWFK